MAHPTIANCLAARAVFAWALEDGRINRGRFKELMRSVRSSQNRLQRCVGKDAFDDWDTALTVAKRNRNRDRNCYPYRCPHCHQVHIGTHGKVHAARARSFRRRRRMEIDMQELESA